ncbi:Uncharacterised protein [Mycobacteroides abscessus subsp. abscessus]|nr:Uncharacterised protein [Mycobacteroides abscessus subsp. abscessus]
MGTYRRDGIASPWKLFETALSLMKTLREAAVERGCLADSSSTSSLGRTFKR